MRMRMMFPLVVVGLIVHTNVAAVAHAYPGPQTDAVFQARPLISELTVTGERDEAHTVTFDEIGVPVQILNPATNDLYPVGTIVGGVSQGASIARISIAPCTATTGDASVRLVCVALSELTEAGTYEGAIDITNNNDPGDSINVTAVVPEADTATATMISGDLAARATHHPFATESMLQPIETYVRATDERTLFPVGALVGSATGPGPTGRLVRIACPTAVPIDNAPVEATALPEPDRQTTSEGDQSANITRVCLTAQGLSTVGTYTGPVDVTDNDTDDHVSLSITVADHIGWAILAAIVGVGLYVGLGFAYNWWVSSKLSEKAKTLQQRIAARNAEKDSRRGYTLNAEEHLNAFEAQFNAYKQSLVWDTSGEEHQAMDQLLKTVEEDIDRFDKQLKPGLDTLEERLREFKLYLQSDPVGVGAEAVPPLAAIVNKQGTGVDLPVGTVQPRLELWDRQGLLLQTWMTMAAAIQRYRAWIERFRPRFSELTPDEQNNLRYVEARLREASHELYDVEESTDLERLRVQHELDSIYRTLAQLGGKYNEWQSLKQPAEAIQDLSLQQQNLLPPQRWIEGFKG